MSSPAAIETERLSALHELGLVGTSPEGHFDAVCRTARALFSVPIALVTLVDAETVWLKARSGTDIDCVPRGIGFCSRAILSDDPLVIADTATDPDHAGHPLVVSEPHIRFYAGVPLMLRDGMRLGTLCILDRVPRDLSPSQLRQLRDLADIVVTHMRLHDVSSAKGRSDAALRDSQARYRSLAESLPQMVWVLSGKERATTYRNACFRDYYGEDAGGGEPRVSRNHPDDVGPMSRAWMAAIASGGTVEVEGRLRRRDGIYRWHKIVMIPVHRDEDVTEWLGTALDIHDIIVARDKLEETTDLLRLAQEAAGAAVWEWDRDLKLVRHSPDSARMFGLSCPPGATCVEVGEEQWAAQVHVEDRSSLEAAHRQAFRTGATSYGIDFRTQPRKEGDEVRWMTGFGRIVRSEATGKVVRIVGLSLDGTERRRIQEALVASEARMRVSEERLALALDSGSDGLWDLDVVSGNFWLSDRCHTILGHEPGGVEGTLSLWRELLHPEDRAEAQRALDDHIAGRSPGFESEHRLRTKDGAYAWVLTRGRVVARDGQGQPLRMVGTHIDIGARKEAEQRVSHMARHDALTDLPNRTLFHEHLDQRLADVRGGRGQLGLLFLDLDRFKTVNDTLGHLAGDTLLRVVANRLRDMAGEACTVARLGGDEFAVILPRLQGAQDASALAQRIIDGMAQPIDIEGRFMTIGVSIGITIAPGDGIASSGLLKNADVALYRSKAAGRNTYQFYETGMDAAIADRHRLEFDLREAVIGGALSLHYQPVMAVSEGTVCGFEALMRWSHETRGMVSPAEFIPLAEETGLIVPLGSWALHEACREAAAWTGELRVAVNVSTLQFQQPGLEESVAAALAASGLAPNRLELEITESVLMHDAESVIACLHRLRALGVRIALDDFGTGYSSLAYLRSFPFDKIKIDRSFIRDISDPDAAAIVRAVVGLGARLGTTITAEGVETLDQFDCVRREGCTEVQGFLFSKPLSASEALAFSRGGVKRAA